MLCVFGELAWYAKGSIETIKTAERSEGRAVPFYREGE